MLARVLAVAAMLALAWAHGYGTADWPDAYAEGVAACEQGVGDEDEASEGQ